MTTSYPAGLDSFTNPAAGDQTQTAIGGRTHSQMHTDVNDALEAIEAELGTDPSGSFATVKARIAALESCLPRVAKVGSYMGPGAIINGALGSSAFASGSVPFLEFVIRKPISIDQLGFRVTTAQAVNAKVLLYSSDSDGYPSTLVKDSGGISCAATGDLLATFANVSLDAGTYWAAIRSNGGTTLRFLCCTQTPRSVISSGTTNIWNAVNYLSADPGTYAAPNATLSSWGDGTTTGSTDVMPVIFMRRSV